MPDHQKRPADRYPGYDVMKKRFSPSWNDQTRRVIEPRMAPSDVPAFFTPEEFETVRAIAARIVPQREDKPIPVAALVDRKLQEDIADGYRLSGMPKQREAWRLGLKAIDVEAGRVHGARFAALAEDQQDAFLRAME